MRKLVVDEWVSLDGVVQGPSSPDEDTEGGFDRGGWHAPFMDEDAMAWVLRNVGQAGAFVFGRRTYEIFAAYWPNAQPEERALSDPFNQRPKYVASRTLREPLPWENSTLLSGDIPAALAELKAEEGGDLHILGSTQLTRTLLPHGLVDELRFMIDPVVVGAGKRLFEEAPTSTPLRLVESETTSRGAVLLTYAVGAG
jgi:dihydrofolate reductase